MADQPPNSEKEKETPDAASAREAFIFEKEKREQEENLRRQQLLKDQSLREGFRYLFRSVIQFILFTAVGALLVILGRSLQKTDSAQGTALIVVGAGCILKGMISFSGRSQ